MIRTTRLQFTQALVAALPATVHVFEEPYSGGTTPDTSLASEIDGMMSGFTATFSIPGASGCTWDFGDGTTAEGNPVEHTYAENGRYEVSATGTEVSTHLFWGGGLLLAGFVVMGLTRQREA